MENKFTCNMLQIPVELIRYCHQQKLVKPFAVFVYLKFHSSGKIQKGSPVFAQLMNDLEIKDNRTLQAHIGKLRELNWIGYNPDSEYYFIRSLNKIVKNLNLSSKIVAPINESHLKNFRAFMTASVITADVNRNKFYHEIAVPRKLKAATQKKHVANQSLDSKKGFNKPDYYGISNKRIANLLGCSQTRATELKKESEMAGLIETRHHFKRIAVLKNSDAYLRPQLQSLNMQFGNRIRFRKCNENGSECVEVLEQLTDEIKGKIKLKTRRRK